MEFKIFHFTLHHTAFGAKEGFLLQTPEGAWSEVSPLPGRSRETLYQTLEQLKAVRDGYQGPLFPSVAFGVFGLSAPRLTQAPVCLFLMGTPADILKQAKKNHGCKTAKIKLGGFNLSTALFLIKQLKGDFRLRIDIGTRWSQKDLQRFCSEFTPGDFDFIEDPGYDISPFPMASDDASIGSVTVWKPMIRGLPKRQAPVILSSSYESGIGLHQIAALAHHLEIPLHPLGIGTLVNMHEDLLEDPLEIREGELHFPSEFRIKQEKLTLC
jgi:O-succinylbenzoate synthase